MEYLLSMGKALVWWSHCKRKKEVWLQGLRDASAELESPAYTEN